ncbi:hypothetical protein GYMLUDRAFT_253331 [Collybiopsis luxurians FD-317 M1]|uniref:Nucleoplasmin-like domain-containing protein n=1 Tax=Collybiopsis luxurians FD-317 M1 TaxID=944289 RepID=A0A0D0AIU3_9AGAR|nr:hypothetical protein GYMLUDRAFT_253331 [Collybiopsis luxurians FD-317 M1]
MPHVSNKGNICIKAEVAFPISLFPSFVLVSSSLCPHNLFHANSNMPSEKWSIEISESNSPAFLNQIFPDWQEVEIVTASLPYSLKGEDTMRTILSIVLDKERPLQKTPIVLCALTPGKNESSKLGFSMRREYKNMYIEVQGPK